MTPAISVAGVERRYRDHRALTDVTFEIGTPCIAGLVGRNGAGKTTLLRILAGQEFATSGQVQVFGAGPLENDAVPRRMILVREDQTYPDLRVRHAISAASLMYPNWDGDLAGALLDAYELPTARPIKKLSRGMRTALGIVVGLAARAELTLFDEPYAGLDAVARTLFYDQLLADCTAHPRCIVLSTHLMDEAAGLLDRVLILDRGRLVLDAPTDDLRGTATTVTGPARGVERFVAGRTTLSRRTMGAQTRAVMVGRLDDRDRGARLERHRPVLHRPHRHRGHRPPRCRRRRPAGRRLRDHRPPDRVRRGRTREDSGAAAALSWRVAGPSRCYTAVSLARSRWRRSRSDGVSRSRRRASTSAATGRTARISRSPSSVSRMRRRRRSAVSTARVIRPRRSRRNSTSASVALSIPAAAATADCSMPGCRPTARSAAY